VVGRESLLLLLLLLLRRRPIHCLQMRTSRPSRPVEREGVDG